MFLADLVNGDAIPTLAMSVRFAAQRQRLIANQVANFSTPDARTPDVAPEGFQKMLREALDERRRSGGRGPLPWRETDEIRRGADGELVLRPRTPTGNILFHDRNDRDPERAMQALAENSLALRTSVELLRGRMEILRSAIAQRAG
jgi:flagellar basal body rod protein FlgB